MNKSGLVVELASRANVSHATAERVVNAIIDSMTDTLVDGGRIEIRGFGSFDVREYEAYNGRNPKTGEPVAVKAKRVPFFKAGKELRERIKSD